MDNYYDDEAYERGTAAWYDREEKEREWNYIPEADLRFEYCDPFERAAEAEQAAKKGIIAQNNWRKLDDSVLRRRLRLK